MTSARYPKIGQYAMVPLWLLEHSAIATSPQAIRVYAWLDARYGSADGRVRVRQEQLATELDVSRATLQRALDALRQAGALRTATRHGRDGRRSHLEYRVIHDRPRASFPVETTSLSVTSEAKAQPVRLRLTSEVKAASLSLTSEAKSMPHQCSNIVIQRVLSDPDQIRWEGARTSQDQGADAARSPDDEPPPVNAENQNPETTEGVVQPDLPLARTELHLAPAPARSILFPPAFLDADFRARCGSVTFDLAAWYAETLAAHGEQPIPDPVTFWREAFKAQVAPQLAAAVSRPADPFTAAFARVVREGCPHPTPCDDQRTCAWRLVREADVDEPEELAR